MSGFVTLQELALGAQTRPIDTKQRKWDCWCLEAVVAIARRYRVILTGIEIQEIYKKLSDIPITCRWKNYYQLHVSRGRTATAQVRITKNLEFKPYVPDELIILYHAPFGDPSHEFLRHAKRRRLHQQIDIDLS